MAYNAAAVHRLLAGEPGPVRDAVLVNAAAALATQGPLDGDLGEAVAAGMARAAESIDSGAAAQVLGRWIEVAKEAQARLTGVRPRGFVGGPARLLPTRASRHRRALCSSVNFPATAAGP